MKKSSLTNFSSIKTLMFTALVMLFSNGLFAQVTSSSIGGIIKDKKSGETLIGASVIAVHVPSGTRYGSVTNEDGRFFMPSVRVGGPYKVTVTFVGYKEQMQEGVFAALGTTANVSMSISTDEAVMQEVVITANKNDVFSSNRTGAASTVNSAQLAALPTVGARSINDFTKYNTQGDGRSFNGQDSRLNNITLDGSVFNNGFGLGNSAIAGGRTNSTAFSLDAIEEIQVNVAPFDIRQSGFVGAGVNAVTRSGTNQVSGSVYTSVRNQDLIGTKARALPVTVTKFQENIYGGRLGGAIIKNKLFYFVNFETQRRVDPATPYVASGSSNAGIPTRVTKSDLETLSSFMRDKFGYETGAYENFNYKTKSDKFLVRMDYNISDVHKATLRYSQHNSITDFPISNSNSGNTAGNGNRTLLSDGLSMAFENSGYQIQDNTKSLVAELNSTLGSKWSNTFIASYNYQNEDRVYKAAVFPTIDILNNGTTYMSVGMDPFTPGNKLDYTTRQFTDNLRYYQGKNTFTLGASFERFTSNNLFFPVSNGAYTFNSLSDFYTAANSYLTNPNDTLKSSTARLQYRYSALPGGIEPLQKLGVNTFSIYGQVERQVTPRLNMTLGIRATTIAFDKTALTNLYIKDSLKFKDPTDSYKDISVNTGLLPKTQTLLEPRLGFNFDVMGDKTLQVRGGTGMFTGRPPFVWISNQVGNNGILTNFLDAGQVRGLVDSKGNRINPFSPTPSVFTPATAEFSLANARRLTYDLSYTDENYKFPQVWKTNIAVDYKLPLGIVASVEAMYNKNINAVIYYNNNLGDKSAATFSGPDTRPRFGAATNQAVIGSTTLGAANGVNARLNANVLNLYTMGTTNEGYNYLYTLKLEKTMTKEWGGMVAYTRQVTKDLMSAGSTAGGTFGGLFQSQGPNNAPLAFSDYDIPHRVIGYLSYRLGYGKLNPFGGDIVFSLGFQAAQSSRFSYTIGGDMNGDGITNNDLVFVPNKASDLLFTANRIAATNTTFTPQQQADAFEAFIAQDPYLSSRRGQYTERNAGLLPWLGRCDLSIAKNFALKFGENKNTLQFRVDITNFGNLVNKNWGVGQRNTGRSPLAFAGLGGADGKTPVYRLATQTVSNTDGSSSTYLLKNTYVNNNNLGDVYQIQLGLRYSFN
jgi:Carboxypeptidase regulatory-like domain